MLLKASCCAADIAKSSLKAFNLPQKACTSHSRCLDIIPNDDAVGPGDPLKIYSSSTYCTNIRCTSPRSNLLSRQSLGPPATTLGHHNSSGAWWLSKQIIIARASDRAPPLLVASLFIQHFRRAQLVSCWPATDDFDGTVFTIVTTSNSAIWCSVRFNGEHMQSLGKE